MSTAPEPGFGPLPLTLRIFCAIPFLTGLADILGGAAFLQTAGANLPPLALSNPMLNSEIKFWGIIWFGYGVTLWWVSARLRTQSALFRILMGTLCCSGLGRALSFALYGSPGFVLTGAMVLELAGGAGLWAWYQSMTHKA